MEGLFLPQLTDEECNTLLALARSAVEAAASHTAPPPVDLSQMPAALAVPAACFVTLTVRGSADLRGCTGVLVARAPLAEEVVHTANQTALHDPRFASVRPDEVDNLDIEISVLTPPSPLEFDSPGELPRLLRPGVDGVTLKVGHRRATFLPQVWHKIPDPVEFLSRLCLKMGVSANTWRETRMDVEIYQVIEFSDQKRRG
jgi:hypothetical protein